MQISKIKIYIIICMVLLLTACASGSAIVTGTVREPIDSNQVKLYTDYPEKYETIGVVKASSDAGWTEQGSQDYAVAELKKQAAKLGANGVVLANVGESNSSIVGTYANGGVYTIPVSAQTVTGTAIYVGD